jgi:hypothetical protein
VEDWRVHDEVKGYGRKGQVPILRLPEGVPEASIMTSGLRADIPIWASLITNFLFLTNHLLRFKPACFLWKYILTRSANGEFSLWVHCMDNLYGLDPNEQI